MSVDLEIGKTAAMHARSDALLASFQQRSVASMLKTTASGRELQFGYGKSSLSGPPRRRSTMSVRFLA